MLAVTTLPANPVRQANALWREIRDLAYGYANADADMDRLIAEGVDPSMAAVLVHVGIWGSDAFAGAWADPVPQPSRATLAQLLLLGAKLALVDTT